MEKLEEIWKQLNNFEYIFRILPNFPNKTILEKPMQTFICVML